MTEINKRALYIAQECLKAGMTMAGAAGILANIEAESAFSSTNVQDSYEALVGNDASYTARVDNGSYQNFTGDSAGYGLAQWTAGDRKEDLLKYAKSRGKSIGDFAMQVSFLLCEIRRYTRAWASCTTGSDPYQCGYDVCKYYEICDNLEAQSQYRGNQAKTKWYSFLKASLDSGLTVEPPKTEQQEAPKVDDDGIRIPQTWPPRTVDSHCTGWPEVKLLQTLLLCRGYSVLTDGIWTETLTRALRIFQGANGLTADGVVGPNTYKALGINPAIFD